MQVQSEGYQSSLGAMIAVQLCVHMRHLRNLFLFRTVIRNKGIRGRMEHSRPPVLRLSSAEFLMFSLMFVLLFAFTHSSFVLGAAVSCLSVAAKHLRLSRKSSATSTATVQSHPGGSRFRF